MIDILQMIANDPNVSPALSKTLKPEPDEDDYAEELSDLRIAYEMALEQLNASMLDSDKRAWTKAEGEEYVSAVANEQEAYDRLQSAIKRGKP